MEAGSSLVTWGETERHQGSCKLKHLEALTSRDKVKDGETIWEGSLPSVLFGERTCHDLVVHWRGKRIFDCWHVKVSLGGGKTLGTMSFKRRRLRCSILIQRGDCGYRWQGTAIFPTDPNKALKFVSPRTAWTHAWSSFSHKEFLDLWSTSFWTIKTHSILQRHIDKEPGFKAPFVATL